MFLEGWTSSPASLLWGKGTPAGPLSVPGKGADSALCWAQVALYGTRPEGPPRSQLAPTALAEITHPKRVVGVARGYEVRASKVRLEKDSGGVYGAFVFSLRITRDCHVTKSRHQIILQVRGKEEMGCFSDHWRCRSPLLCAEASVPHVCGHWGVLLQPRICSCRSGVGA